MDDMNLEVNRDESRDAAKKRNRLEPVSPLGRPRERGITGKVGGDEFSRISVQELLTTISTTTDEKELTRLRQEKARRWEVLASQIGEEGLQGIKVGVGILVERAREGKSPKEGEKIPAVVAKIAELKPEIIGLEQQALVGQVIRDEFRIQTLNQGLVPGEIAEETREQEARQRVTDLTGVPVTEYKRGYRPQAGVEIKAPVEEEPKIEEAKESGELKPETVRTISTLVAGGLAVDEVLEELVKLGGVTDGMRGLVDRLVGKREAVEKAAEENTKVAEEKPGPVEKEARPLTWVEIELKLTEYASDQAQGLATAISEDEKTELLKQRRGLVNEEEAKEATRGRKAGVAGLYQKIVDDDQMAGRSGRQRENPLDLFVRGLEDMKRGAGEPEGRLEGVVAAWLDGVERNAEIWAMEAEHKLRAEAGLRPSEELDKRLQALRIEKGLLNWGALKDPTRGRLDALAKAYADWVENVGPEADDYKRVRAAAEEEARRRAEIARLAGESRGGGAVIPVVDREGSVRNYFGERFIRDHGLPHKVYIYRGTYKEETDMSTMLYGLFMGTSTEGFDERSIREAMVEEEKERAERERRTPDVNGVTERAAVIFNNFLYGIYPMMRLNLAESNHTLRAWVGPEGGAGMLNEIKPNMKWIAQELRKDRQALSAMRVWLALGGGVADDFRRITGTTAQERLIVDRHIGSFKEMMKVKEYGELRDALMSHEKAKRTMDEVAEEIEKELGLDKGVISLTREIVNLLAWSPETIDARKQIAKFESNLLKEDTKASRPPIGRTMYPGGPTFDSFLSAGGVEAMLEQIQIWTHAKDWLILTYEGMQGLIKNLQVFQDMVGGKDIYENLSARRKALNELIDKMMVHKEFPPVDDETASRWRKMKLYGGRGKTAGEKRFGTFDVKDQASEAFGGEIQAVKNLLSSIFGGEG